MNFNLFAFDTVQAVVGLLGFAAAGLFFGSFLGLFRFLLFFFMVGKDRH